MNFFVERGFGAWEDDSRTRCHIFFRSPAEWAAKIYDHARRLRLFDSMFTIYEIANGDFAVGEGALCRVEGENGVSRSLA